ncbi:MAG: hypothetical protein HOP18_26445 [Deltaproteobacteria bacterium]|nr:hypothetical protein [Deltaproteobacteria bacterium]
MNAPRSPRRLKPKRPRWSLRTNFFGAIGVIVLVSLITIFALKKSLWIELEIILGILSLFMFTYFFLLLYHGVRFDRNETFLITWRPSFSDLSDASSYIDTGGTFTGGGAEAGPLGLVIGFLLDLLVSILLTFLLAVVLWLGLNVVVTVIVVLGTPLFFLFRRSVPYIVAKGRACHQDFSRAGWFALRATVFNTLWFYAMVLGAHYLAGLKGT